MAGGPLYDDLQKGDRRMPSDTLMMLIPVFGAFAFFAVSLIYADMTWRPKR
jgi:hypothetical protein